MKTFQEFIKESNDNGALGAIDLKYAKITNVQAKKIANELKSKSYIESVDYKDGDNSIYISFKSLAEYSAFCNKHPDLCKKLELK